LKRARASVAPVDFTAACFDEAHNLHTRSRKLFWQFAPISEGTAADAEEDAEEGTEEDAEESTEDGGEQDVQLSGAVFASL